ncbi:SOS response UmuD protein. Serine peptidase. MEROPS family S24 [Actinopolyspora mzabensis]|uniref:SOS response UmuD protein. Serine peptidase. MEROPS family S24 n=1 Tax=Actinopolyspora mzabensis TaxID=995066 RepID=A0A1G9CFL5_ACTMZ|nr:S24 family peptidase [Actinopolyspora mzabensis]SDK50376.1 SOS response UmuD protein. Serine peptidase. MEROPS family S24 [Actinopolyspora mzabensis]
MTDGQSGGRRSRGPVIPEGFASPAEDYGVGVDLTAWLMPRPAATYLWRARGSGEVMAEEGIAEGDELLVDRSVPPRRGHLVIAIDDTGDFLLRRLEHDPPAGQVFEPVPPEVAVDVDGTGVWGVVTVVIHHVLRRKGR